MRNLFDQHISGYFSTRIYCEFSPFAASVAASLRRAWRGTTGHNLMAMKWWGHLAETLISARHMMQNHQKW
jgi:hypothetical protein